MSAPEPAADERARLEAALGHVHKSVIALVAVCALVAWTQPGDGGTPPDRAWTWAAVGLALVSVIARRQGTLPGWPLRRRLWATLVGLAAAGGVAVVGALLAALRDQPESGLLFCLAALIFALRPPRLALPPPRPPRTPPSGR